MSTFLEYTELFSQWAVPLLILTIVCWAAYKQVPMYESFVTGAKEGFQVAVMIIPYLVAILFAIKIFVASGAFEDMKLVGGWIMDRVGLGDYRETLDLLPLAPHQTALRQRCTRRDDRDLRHPRTRQLSGQDRLDHDGQHRDDLLHPDRLLRLNSNQKTSPHAARLPDRRRGGHRRGDRDRLSPLRITRCSRSTHQRYARGRPTIALVVPASPVPRDPIERAIAAYESLGFRIKVYGDLYRKHGLPRWRRSTARNGVDGRFRRSGSRRSLSRPWRHGCH